MTRFIAAIGCALLSSIGLWSGPALAQAAKGKPIVAIYEMEDPAGTHQADQFSRMIETAVTATGKFRVIERERLGKVVGEQARAKAGLVTSRTPGRVGGFAGADFLVYGSITNVSVSRKADLGASFLGGMLAGSNGARPSCSNAVATISIDIKITDADSGEVRYVKRIDETLKSAAVCDGSTQVNTGLLLRSAADKVATGLVTAVYPIQIAAVQADGVVVLNYGEGAVAPGALMGVFSKGQAIVDPANGEVIGNDETRLGLIRVTDVTARFSKAELASAFSAPPPVGAIVRIATAADIQSFANKKRKR